MLPYKQEKQTELKKLKALEKELSNWISNNIKLVSTDLFMQKFKERNSLRHKIKVCEDRLIDRSRKSGGINEVKLPSNINNNLNF